MSDSVGTVTIDGANVEELGFFCYKSKPKSPMAYGVFAIVCDGRLLTYHYLGNKELRRLNEEFLPLS